MEEGGQRSIIRPSSGTGQPRISAGEASPLSMNLVGGEIDVFLIPEPTFDQATSGSTESALDQTFLGVALGGVIAILLMVFATPELSETTRTILVWAGGVTMMAALYFRVVVYQQKHRATIVKIKQGPRLRDTDGRWFGPSRIAN